MFLRVLYIPSGSFIGPLSVLYDTLNVTDMYNVTPVYIQCVSWYDFVIMVRTEFLPCRVTQVADNKGT